MYKTQHELHPCQPPNSVSFHYQDTFDLSKEENIHNTVDVFLAAAFSILLPLELNTLKKRNFYF